MSARLGLKGIPAEAEEIMAIRDILLARLTGGHVHLCHMSTRGSVELIRWGKERGINVTAEVCPHHLSLTEEAVEGYDTNAKMNPPLRTADDVEALQQAVRDGTIDLIATDHAPHHYDEKEREFADAPNGIVGLETALAVNITWLVAPGIIDLRDARRADVVRAGASVQAAGRHASQGQPRRRDGVRSDAEWTVDPARFRSKGRNTPYAGKQLRGRVHCTIVDGRVDPSRSGVIQVSSDESLRRQIVRVCRRLYERGLIAGGEGNVSARLARWERARHPRGGCRKSTSRRATW